MGNCLSPASKHLGLGLMTMEEEEERQAEVKRISQEEQAAEVDAEQQEAAAEGLKVKVVLTRAELEWLMAQLKSGERRLEDVIHHMRAAAAVARGAKDGSGWRPRLESIVEAPGDAAAATAAY
jgi:hypothetical protein